jgi:cell division protein FtsL
MKNAVLITVFLSLNVVSAITVVKVRHDIRSELAQLERCESERDGLNIDWGRLQIEQSTWAGHGRVRQKATEQLKMRMPQASEWMFVRDKEG